MLHKTVKIPKHQVYGQCYSRYEEWAVKHEIPFTFGKNPDNSTDLVGTVLAIGPHSNNSFMQGITLVGIHCHKTGDAFIYDVRDCVVCEEDALLPVRKILPDDLFTLED